jgi:hypothetical protein
MKAVARADGAYNCDILCQRVSFSAKASSIMNLEESVPEGRLSIVNGW